MLMTSSSCSSSSSGMGNGLNCTPFTSGVMSRTEVSSELQLTLLENLFALTVVSVLQFGAAWTVGAGWLFISCFHNPSISYSSPRPFSDGNETDYGILGPSDVRQLCEDSGQELRRLHLQGCVPLLKHEAGFCHKLQGWRLWPEELVPENDGHSQHC